MAAELSQNGAAILSALRYDPWGLVPTGGAWDSGGSFTNPWRYQGRLDVSPVAGDQLYDYGARFYAPAAGVLTQLDSYAGQALDPRSMNRYLYAEANPATLIDPDGHMATTDDSGYVAEPVGDPDVHQAWEANKQQARADEQRQIDAINTTACQRTGVCSSDALATVYYNPWAVEADPVWNEMKNAISATCIGFGFEQGESRANGCSMYAEMTEWERANYEGYCKSNADLCRDTEAAKTESAILLLLVGIEVGAAAFEIFASGALPATIARQQVSQQRLDRLLALGAREGFTVAARGRWRGLTIIGHSPEYEKLAAEIGARFFSVPNSVWGRLGRLEKLALNRGFLNATISRRDIVQLATPVFKEGGYLDLEIKYLLEVALHMGVWRNDAVAASALGRSIPWMSKGGRSSARRGTSRWLSRFCPRISCFASQA
ncbi:MAG: RHS repeat-associated core domain-containing protein [Chloroflexi bacterium]|nr:RHS repeat-associated core domain-containing protein [Chloroflexota bacterium]